MFIFLKRDCSCLWCCIFITIFTDKLCIFECKIFTRRNICKKILNFGSSSILEPSRTSLQSRLLHFQQFCKACGRSGSSDDLWLTLRVILPFSWMIKASLQWNHSTVLSCRLLVLHPSFCPISVPLQFKLTGLLVLPKGFSPR